MSANQDSQATVPTPPSALPIRTTNDLFLTSISTSTSTQATWKALLAHANNRNLHLSTFERNPAYSTSKCLLLRLRAPLSPRLRPTYHILTIKHLRLELKRRGLARSGTKLKNDLVAVLARDDAATPFRLLDLPAELKAIVHSYVLAEVLPLTAVVPALVAQPALLRVSREVRGESLAVFYSQNRVVVTVEAVVVGGQEAATGAGVGAAGSTAATNKTLLVDVRVAPATEKWLLAIGDDNVRSIRHVAVELLVKSRGVVLNLDLNGAVRTNKHMRFDRTCQHHEAGKVGCGRWMRCRSFEEVLEMDGAETALSGLVTLEHIVECCWTGLEIQDRNAGRLVDLGVQVGQVLFALRKVLG